MLTREVLEVERTEYNRLANHPLQSWEWGEFRQKTGIKVLRLGDFEGQRFLLGYQLTIHPIPHTSFTVGYLPKGPTPDISMLGSLQKIGRDENCLLIKLEPNISPDQKTHAFLMENGCRRGRPFFTKYTFQIDLTRSEEELMAAMKEKTRYNVRLAQKHGVIVKEDNSPTAFEAYLKLTFETTRRQKFFAHDRKYHQLMWEILQPSGIAHLLTASFQGKVLSAWILFLFNNVLYYPYGASSSEQREAMASNLLMWEAIRWGKLRGARMFDLWGALGPNPNPHDPWYGFHRFKEGYGGKLVELIGTYDLVANPFLYPLYNLTDSLRWKLLRLKSYLPL